MVKGYCVCPLCGQEYIFKEENAHVCPNQEQTLSFKFELLKEINHMLRQNVELLNVLNNKYKGLMKRVVTHANMGIDVPYMHPIIEEMRSIVNEED